MRSKAKYDDRLICCPECRSVFEAEDHTLVDLAAERADALEDAADKFGAHQRSRMQREGVLHPYSEASAWLRDRAACIRAEADR